MNYYNEIDDYAADWIENLIAAGHIPAGIVDRRSIEDVAPSDLAGFTQCHFFAGIAGWSLALRLAGVPDDYPIWTGSCPCQPFSTAGAQAGFADERHLWPAFHWLIAQRSPAIVVGEQVASKIADPWIDLVRADMEALGFAFGAVAFPSASVGAPHIRDRTYWMGHTIRDGLQGWIHRWSNPQRPVEHGSPGRDSAVVRLADTASERLHGRRAGEASDGSDTARIESQRLRDAGGVAHSTGAGSSHRGAGHAQSVIATAHGSAGDTRPGPTNGFWHSADWLSCRDGKWRPVEPGTFPLAHGVSNRVGRLRAYGNAINPWQAAEFLRAIL